MILTFKDKDTEALFSGVRVKRWVNIQTVAMRKLAMLNRAAALNDLKIPPQNHLEVLKRDRKGQHSIRINEQWRMCFRWTATGSEEVEICDYH